MKESALDWHKEKEQRNCVGQWLKNRDWGAELACKSKVSIFPVRTDFSGFCERCARNYTLVLKGVNQT